MDRNENRLDSNGDALSWLGEAGATQLRDHGFAFGWCKVSVDEHLSVIALICDGCEKEWLWFDESIKGADGYPANATSFEYQARQGALSLCEHFGDASTTEPPAAIRPEQRHLGANGAWRARFNDSRWRS